MRVALLCPVSCLSARLCSAERECLANLLAEGLSGLGVDVTLSLSDDHGRTPCSGLLNERSITRDCLRAPDVFENEDQFDLAHNLFDFLPLTYAGFTRIPVVSTIHGAMSRPIAPALKKYNHRVHYVAMSEADKNPELDYAATINCGIRLEDFPLCAGPRDYLLSISNGRLDNGVAEAIETARISGVRLVIAGAPNRGKLYEEVIKPSVDEGMVTLAGAVNPKSLPGMLGGARALLHLGDFEDSTGFGIIESMAVGTPVIASPVGSAPDMIRDGVSGFIVNGVDEAGSVVGRLAETDPAGCRAVMEEKFTMERMAREYHALYEKILAGRENHRPWGYYENLGEEKDHKVKRIVVAPGKRLSLQKHSRRAEHWVVVSGEAVVTLDDRQIPLNPGQAVDIPKNSAHRIMNPGSEPLVFIETQMGDYFGEDDIIRLEDDYGRAP